MNSCPISVNSRRLRGLNDLQSALDLNLPILVVSVLFPGGASIAIERDETFGDRLPDADEIEMFGIAAEMRRQLLDYASRNNADGQMMRFIINALADRINSLKNLANVCDAPFQSLTHRGMRIRQIASQLWQLVDQLANNYGQSRSLLPTENTVAA